MDKSERGSQYLREKFKKLRKAKIKEGIFVGPHIRNLFRDLKYFTSEEKSMNSFKMVCENFLQNYRAEYNRDLIKDLLDAYTSMGCHMALKIYLLHFHLDFFPEMLVTNTLKSFIRTLEMEKRYQGKSSVNMLLDYCWRVLRNVPTAKRSQKNHLKVCKTILHIFYIIILYIFCKLKYG